MFLITKHVDLYILHILLSTKKHILATLVNYRTMQYDLSSNLLLQYLAKCECPDVEHTHIALNVHMHVH